MHFDGECDMMEGHNILCPSCDMKTKITIQVSRRILAVRLWASM